MSMDALRRRGYVGLGLTMEESEQLRRYSNDGTDESFTHLRPVPRAESTPTWWVALIAEFMRSSVRARLARDDDRSLLG